MRAIFHFTQRRTISIPPCMFRACNVSTPDGQPPSPKSRWLWGWDFEQHKYRAKIVTAFDTFTPQKGWSYVESRPLRFRSEPGPTGLHLGVCYGASVLQLTDEFWNWTVDVTKMLVPDLEVYAWIAESGVEVTVIEDD